MNENFFCVADLHAITVPQDPGELEESTLASATLYIAADESPPTVPHPEAPPPRPP